MPWGRLDDQANGNAKLLALSDSAYRMWACGVIYCQANLTNGRIPDAMIHSFGVRHPDKQALADELCARLVKGKGPLWHRVNGGYQMHHYLHWNDSKTKVLEARRKANDRLKRFRKRVSQRDPNAVRSRVHDHVPRTSLSKDQKGSYGARVFHGQRLKVSRKQHEVVMDEIGTWAAHIDISARYEQWDRELAASGEDFDTLPFIKARARACVDAARRGGSLLPAKDGDWFEECKQIHDGACGGDRMRHHLRKQVDEEKAHARVDDGDRIRAV